MPTPVEVGPAAIIDAIVGSGEAFSTAGGRHQGFREVEPPSYWILRLPEQVLPGRVCRSAFVPGKG